MNDAVLLASVQVNGDITDPPTCTLPAEAILTLFFSLH